MEEAPLSYFRLQGLILYMLKDTLQKQDKIYYIDVIIGGKPFFCMADEYLVYELPFISVSLVLFPYVSHLYSFWVYENVISVRS